MARGGGAGRARTQTDADGDGFGEVCECADTDSTSYPSAPELCDGLDNSCDEAVDEGCSADQDTGIAPKPPEGCGCTSGGPTFSWVGLLLAAGWRRACRSRVRDLAVR